MKNKTNKLIVFLSLFIMLFAFVRFKSAASADTYVSINNYTVPSNVESVGTKNEYSWSTYSETNTLISGNKNVSTSVSSLKITVKGTGALYFEYRVYSPTSDEESNPDSLIVSVGTEVTTDTSYTSLVNNGASRYYGDTGWKTYTLRIEKEENELTDIYIAYKKNGAYNDDNDCALIKNISFANSETIVSATSSDSSLGTVSGSGTYFATEEVTLTATETNNGKFYGWAVNGSRIDELSSTYTFIASVDVNVTAIFGDKDLTCCWNRRTGTIYNSLNEALTNAIDDDVIELLEDSTLTENATIPNGVKLYIPYSNIYDEDGNADGTASDSKYFATSDKTYKCLTIVSGTILTVNGNLLIGGVISYPAQYYQGHTSGAHGRITNNGNIIVSGGRIDCYGFIDGSGTLKTTSGSVYEPFVVLDFAGGNNCLNLYEAGQNSFTEYTMQNISCTLVIEGSGALGAYCNLYASSQYNKINTIFVGNKNTYPQALVAYDDGSSVTRTVDKTKYVSAGIMPNDNQYGADIGKTKYTINGGATLENLHMVIYGFDICVDKFPIPYTFDFVLDNGNYIMPNGWNIMPGASLTVNSDANLTVEGSLYVLDGLINKGLSGKYYPSTEKLISIGISPSGEFIVNGKVTFKKDSIFGGIVQSKNIGATIVIEDGVSLNNSSVQFGATACYDDNTCIMDLNGRVKTSSGLVTLQTNKTYKSQNTDSWVLDSYTALEYANNIVTSIPASGKYVGIPSSKNGNTYGQYKVYAGPTTVTLNETMYGEFAIDGEGIEITYNLVNKTYYDDLDDTRTTVSNPSYLDNTVKFTVSLKDDGSGYAYIVKYSFDGNSFITINPNANGEYLIENPSSTVYINVISIKKGDVDLDGEITAADVTKLRRSLAGYSTITDEYMLLAADVDGDEDITAADVTKLRRYLAGYINKL